MHVFAPPWKWTRYACKSKSVLRKHLARTYYVRYVGMCVCVSSALIWCLNKWFLPPRVCLQYITLATMELPLSSSLGTSRSLAHAWPRGKCRPVNNTEMLNDVRTPTQDALSDTVSAYRTCSLLIIIFISWYAYPLFFWTHCEAALFLSSYSCFSHWTTSQGEMVDICFR